MKPHRFDALSFLSGLVIAVIGLLFLIPQNPNDLFRFIGDIGSWFWPVLLLAIGVAVLAPIVSRSSRRDGEDELEEEA